MDGLWWKLPSNWLIWGYAHFRKPPYVSWLCHPPLHHPSSQRASAVGSDCHEKSRTTSSASSSRKDRRSCTGCPLGLVDQLKTAGYMDDVWNWRSAGSFMTFWFDTTIFGLNRPNGSKWWVYNQHEDRISDISDFTQHIFQSEKMVSHACKVRKTLRI